MIDYQLKNLRAAAFMPKVRVGLQRIWQDRELSIPGPMGLSLPGPATACWQGAPQIQQPFF